ncbi:hypothetical protein [Corallococcus exiguus]|uniref:Uncharacterized protein n=1 Tax=Corallococcus exiguus TaxID=83462 RepID=A0A7X5BVV8_9BACT|nr:hypothetical protein [Corallococcus exiguus]NBC45855.1 hypothetical protein [Corallococcus exiguus]
MEWEHGKAMVVVPTLEADELIVLELRERAREVPVAGPEVRRLQHALEDHGCNS